MKIFHNPRCSKSREALQLLNDKGISPEIILYLENIPEASDLKRILSQLNISAYQLLRKNEALFKKSYKDKEMSEEEWIDVMVKNPKLIERPIVISENKAVVARPPERVNELF